MKGFKGFRKGKDNPAFGEHSWNFGKHPSVETLKKQSESHKGYIPSEEQKRKQSEALKGKPKPDGFREKVSGKNHHNWKGGKIFQVYTMDWTKTLKRSIRERDHYICQVCSSSGDSVHHIDYNKKNCNPDNLVTLCHHCHMKTNFHREYWIKYFKKYE